MQKNEARLALFSSRSVSSFSFCRYFLPLALRLFCRHRLYIANYAPANGISFSLIFPPASPSSPDVFQCNGMIDVSPRLVSFPCSFVWRSVPSTWNVCRFLEANWLGSTGKVNVIQRWFFFSSRLLLLNYVRSKDLIFFSARRLLEDYCKCDLWFNL